MTTNRFKLRWAMAAVACSLTLAIAACSSTPSTNSAASNAPPEVAVTVTNTGCEPNQLSVAAGKTTFVITNKSDRTLEWEILKGVMVMEERENIAPGFVQKLTATLEPGEYGMACGLLSNPKGTLTVTAPAN